MTQNLSVDKSRQLIAAGVDVSSASGIDYEAMPAFSVADLVEEVPVFSLNDLIDLLPKRILTPISTHTLNIQYDPFDDKWSVAYQNVLSCCDDLGSTQSDPSLSEALGKLLIWHTAYHNLSNASSL